MKRFLRLAESHGAGVRLLVLGSEHQQWDTVPRDCS